MSTWRMLHREGRKAHVLGEAQLSPYSWVYTQNRHTSTPSIRWNSRMTCSIRQQQQISKKSR